MADYKYVLEVHKSDGSVEEVDIEVPQGEAGVSVTGAAINADGHLIISLSEGQPIDAGVAKGNSSYIQVVPDGNNGYYINITNEGEETQQAYISNGKIPGIFIRDIDGGHRVEFYVNESLVNSFDVMDGEKGDKGDSPEVTVEQIDGGHRVTIGGESFDVMDGTGGGGSGATYIANGTRYGSLRTVGAAAESDDYKLGLYSFAEGDGTKASGTASHAEGKITIAAGPYQHAEGSFNVADEDGKYIHIAGNGHAGNPSNAHTLDWDGNAWFRGKVFVGGTGQDDPNAKELGGGSSVSWNDLEDRPFGVETTTTIIEETILEDLQYDTDYTIPFVGVPVVGATYKVKWANVTYECTSTDFSASVGTTCLLMGNVDALTGAGDTGEPFVILLFPGGDGYGEEGLYAQIMCVYSDYLETDIAFGIEMVKVSKIPENLMPDMPGIVFVNITGTFGNNTSDWVADKTFLEAYEAITTGKMVFFKMNMPVGIVIMPVNVIDNINGYIGFATIETRNSAALYKFMPDNTFAVYETV